MYVPILLQIMCPSLAPGSCLRKDRIPSKRQSYTPVMHGISDNLLSRTYVKINSIHKFPNNFYAI